MTEVELDSIGDRGEDSNAVIEPCELLLVGGELMLECRGVPVTVFIMCDKVPCREGEDARLLRANEAVEDVIPIAGIPGGDVPLGKECDTACVTKFLR